MKTLIILYLSVSSVKSVVKGFGFFLHGLSV